MDKFIFENVPLWLMMVGCIIQFINAVIIWGGIAYVKFFIQ